MYAPLSGRDKGVLLSVANGRIAARPFDAARLALERDPQMIDLAAGGNTLQHPAMLSASGDVLASVSAPIPSTAGTTPGIPARTVLTRSRR